jgi:hypothetical protein
VKVQAGEDTIRFVAMGKEWTFAAAAAPLLDKLQTARLCSLDQLCAVVRTTLPPRTVRAFAKELVAAGLATIAAGESGP